MRKLSRTSQISLLIAVFLACVANVFAQDGGFSINKSPLPAPTGYVNDYAGVIDAGTKQRLENLLTNLKNGTNPSVEIAVAVVKTTGERDIFDYSLAVSRGWGIGSKDTANPGALLFVAIDDRKYYTQVSKDLEDELPDGLVGQLQRENLVPEFKKGNYAQGIEDTVNAYVARIAEKQGVKIDGAVKPKPRSTIQPRSGSGLSGRSLLCLIVVGFLLLIIFSRGGGGRGGRGGGGGLGNILLWSILSGVATSGGSSGGSSSSGGWGGGGDSGGGWGGFGGGGDFGGGGAGGGW